MPASPRSVEFHPAARAELARAEDWYLERSAMAADAFVAEIEHAIERISEAPERYPETRQGCRRFVLMNFPFDVVYRFTGETVEVIAVAHHSRLPEYWRSR